MSETITMTELASLELTGILPIAAASLKDDPSIQLSTEDALDQLNPPPAQAAGPTGIPDISRWQSTAIIATVASATMINAMLSGLLIVGLPTMAQDLNLDAGLLLWPASVNALTCGCTLLISGSISDVVGGRNVYLLGCFLLSVTTVACGLSPTGLDLILFRAFQGLALSLCLPSSIQLITRNITTGTRRNIAFACLGASQPVGFSVGLVLGGFFVERVGWRYGWYIGAVLVFIIFVVSIFGVPKDRPGNAPVTLKRLGTDIDWIGCLIPSTSLGFYSYIFSVLAGGASHIVAPVPLTLLILATLLLPLFPLHIKRQERLNRVVIIPTSLWSNVHFSSICIVIFLAWGGFQAATFLMTIYFQSVLLLSPILTSLRFLPMVVTGAFTNFLAGHLVARVPANTLVICSALVSVASPLLMALVNTNASYWLSGFWAIALLPISVDVLFTISNLVITQAFPDEMHGVAGGVFNTLSQIGASVGLAITAVIAASVTAADDKNQGNDAAQLMDGYRAAFWFCFAAGLVALCIVGLGMRRIGKVGLKRD